MSSRGAPPRWRRLVHAALVVLSAAFLMGCPAPASNGTTDAGTPIDPACAARIAASCNKAAECLKVELAVAYGDTDQCVARETLMCPGLYDAPGTVLTAETESDCADAIATLSCDAVFQGPLPAVCDPGPGALAEGTACGYNAQCASHYCRFVSPNICGTCATKAGEGATCAGDADCNDGLGCDITAHCTAIATSAGGPCPCGPGLRCKLGDGGSGTCLPIAHLGDACVEDYDCEGYPFRVCNTQTQICEDVALAMLGEPCGPTPSGGMIACQGGTSEGCVSTAGHAPTCAAPAEDGASCEHAACKPPARCIGAQCIVFNDAWCR